MKYNDQNPAISREEGRCFLGVFRGVCFRDVSSKKMFLVRVMRFSDIYIFCA